MIINNKEKGFTSIDLSMAMLIMILFVSIMSSMLYSVYLSSTEARRTAAALNYGVDIFEEIAQQSFSGITPVTVLESLETEDVKLEGLKTIENTQTKKVTTCKIGTYDITLEMTVPYTDGTIKKFKLTINYAVSAKKTEKLELERIRTNRV